MNLRTITVTKPTNKSQTDNEIIKKKKKPNLEIKNNKNTVQNLRTKKEKNTHIHTLSFLHSNSLKKTTPRSKVVSILVQFVGPRRGVVRLVGVEDPEGVSRVFGEEEREEDRSNQERSR